MIRGNARFLVVEGIDGAGKSTQLTHISELLTLYRIPHEVTREPGGTPMAEQIRSAMLELREERVDPLTELLLVYAARNQHLQRIRSLLEAGTWVVCDRFILSTYAYQIVGRGLDETHYHLLNDLIVGDTLPDMTLFLDVSPETRKLRLVGRDDKQDRLDDEAGGFKGRVETAYRRKIADIPQSVIVDANGDVNDVRCQIDELLFTRLIHPYLRKEQPGT